MSLDVSSRPRSASALESGADQPTKPRLFLDASLILHHGMLSPVGLVRVEHYVAEFLAGDPSVDLRFVRYAAGRGYRELEPGEAALIRDILFRRYWSATALGAAMGEVGTETSEASPPDSFGARLRRACRSTPAEFAHTSGEFLQRRFPVTRSMPQSRRLARKVARRSVWLSLRLAHHGLLLHMTIVDVLRGAFRTPQPTLPAPLERAAQLDTPLRWQDAPFAVGDVLITLSNLWDYVDFEYLHELRVHAELKIVAVIYDVIALDLPFTTPASTDIYHRHWVEMGHLASHLVAISRYTRDRYRHLVSRPNDIEVSMSYAYLPKFLETRAEEIGTQEVAGLAPGSFVVYCSTIESRKNHQLLLFLWDHFRADPEIGPSLPQLVFAGKWGWGTELVRNYSERNWRLRPHLRILLNTSDAELIWLYRNARFTVMPSFAEGFGLSASESLSFGTPVVVADCPALVEATEGLMPALDPLDFPAWYRALKTLIVDDGALAELKAAAARYRGPAYGAFAEAVRDAALGRVPGGPA